MHFERLDQLSDGRIVCGTYSGALILNPDNGQLIDIIDQSDGLPDSDTPCVAATPGNGVWIGTNEGLFRYQATTKQLEPIDIQGVPRVAISRIEVDPSGFVWIVTPQGVTKIDPQQGISQTRVRPLGTSPPELFGALTFSGKYAWAGSTSGLVRTQIRSETPEIVIDGAETDRVLDPSETVECTTDVASIRFHYHAHGATTDHAEYAYRYRLLGQQNHWTITSERSVKLPTPPPGDYVFQVCAFDQDLIQSPPLQIELEVRRPHGRLVRTFLAYASMIASVLFGIFYVSNMRQTRTDLEKRVESRTEEIMAVQREKQQLREELLHSQKMESLGTMAAGVAHDFNNALSAIVCNAELGLLSADDPREVTSALELVMSASEQASCITRSLLTFAGSSPTTSKPVSLQGVIQSSIDLIRSAIPAAIEIAVDTPCSPIWVNADSSQLQQVLVNLCFNARDAMPRGGTITITLTKQCPASGTNNLVSKGAVEAETSVAVLRLSDDGSGMPTEVADRVFEPFFTTKARGKGTGLGLSLAHSIITTHGGTISVESDLGHGTTFEINLPTCSKSLDQESSPNVPRSLEILRGAKVLIADDQKRVRDALAKLMRAASAEVTIATNGEDLIREVSEAGDYSLVIADIDMPKVSGLDAIEKLREANPELPVLLITGLPTSLPEVIEEDRTSFLRKPFRRDVFLAEAARLAGVEQLPQNDSRET